MKKIRDAQTIIGMLEDGEVAAALGTEITETLAKLKELCGGNPKTKVKGSVSLKINLPARPGDHRTCQRDPEGRCQGNRAAHLRGHARDERELSRFRPQAASPSGRRATWPAPSGARREAPTA